MSDEQDPSAILEQSFIEHHLRRVPSHQRATFNEVHRDLDRMRPQPSGSGVTRGPSIVVPHTSLGARRRTLIKTAKRVAWFPAPEEGRLRRTLQVLKEARHHFRAS
jgi:hypothetical protein